MKAALVLLAAICIALTGCGSSITAVQPAAAIPDLTGNWQIQTGATVPAGPSGLLLLGSLQSSGANVTGTFRFSNLGQFTTCGLNQVVALTGTIDAKRNLTLNSAPLPNGTVIKLQLLIPQVLTNFGSGSIEVTGTTCSFATSPAIGSEFASVTGTFAGPLTPGTLLQPVAGTPGTGTLTLTESSTPAPDGQFPVTGTLTYTFGACTATINLMGDASGVGVTLQPTTSLTFSNVLTFLGTTTPTATQITATLSVAPAPCASNHLTYASYTGTLVRQ